MYYSSFRQQEKRRAVALDARTRFPDSPYSRMIGGVQDCIDGRCAKALKDLQAADAQLHEIRALSFLALAYASNEDFLRSAEALDLMRRVAGDCIMTDHVVYVSVVTYVNVGRGEEAKQVYMRFLEAFPGSSASSFMRKSQNVLMQAGLLTPS